MLTKCCSLLLAGLILLVPANTQEKSVVSSGAQLAPSQPVAVPFKGRPIQLPPFQVNTRTGEIAPAGAPLPSAVLYDAFDYNGFYWPTGSTTYEGITLAGPACINGFGFSYIKPTSGSVDVTVQLWTRASASNECSEPDTLLLDFTLTDLPDGWIGVDVSFSPPVFTSSPDLYLALRFSDPTAGWAQAVGTPGSLVLTSADMWYSPDLDPDVSTCWYFGGIPRANFACGIRGSYNTLFRVNTGEVDIDSVRVNLGGGYFRWPSFRNDDGNYYFSAPYDLGEHSAAFQQLPFLSDVVFFDVLSSDPCLPDIVDVEQINGDVDGNNEINDADLLIILFNFGLIGDE